MAKSILVTGDAGPDYDFYLHFDGPNPPPNCDPTRARCSLGGAGLALRVLKAWAGKENATSIGFARSPVDASPTFVAWHPQPTGDTFKQNKGKDKVWRVNRSTSPGELIRGFKFPMPKMPVGAALDFKSGVILLVDNAAGYRHPKGAALPHESAWTGEETIIWKMAPPLCRGELWWRAVKAGVLKRTVVVISIEHLRMEPVRVSCRISWERTALEIARELESNPALAELRSAAHVIVTIHGEGALWCSREDGESRFALVFDPAHMESEWWQRSGADGDAYGYGSVFAAALAAEAAKCADTSEAIRNAIPRGLLAMRVLHAQGHGPVDVNTEPDFPADLLASVIRGDKTALDPFVADAFGHFSAVNLPSDELTNPVSDWQIALSGDGRPANEPLYGLARRVAVYGERELSGVPHARFGKLLTAARSEIEALRNLKTLIEDYQRGNETKPLSLAVFGPPGSGKSFGVKQIADEVLGKAGMILEFNLSQFDDADLAGAFHQVRDKVLEGKMPVVFWDEFDSSEYKWLRLLLAPMNDGKFQEGQITHPLGRCIFVFAGGTSHDMEHFGPSEPPEDSPPDSPTAKEWTRFKLDKGPDFISRIHGALNVLGPNRKAKPKNDGRSAVDGYEDLSFPLRRALLLRALLGLKPRQRLDMDSGLLSAMLEVSEYSNGARSFEKICIVLRDAGKQRQRYMPSDLPADAILAMNVENVSEFKALLKRDDDFKAKAPLLAKAFHDVWRAGKRKQKGSEAFANDCEFDDLPANKKNDNLNAAMRMPRNLQLGGYLLVPASQAGTGIVTRIPEELVDIMAQEEHFRWVEDALADGFRQMGKGEKRDDAQLIHDCILPWEKLPDGQREYDRWFVRNYPEFAKHAEYAIVPRNSINHEQIADQPRDARILQS